MCPILNLQSLEVRAKSTPFLDRAMEIVTYIGKSIHRHLHYKSYSFLGLQNHRIHDTTIHDKDYSQERLLFPFSSSHFMIYLYTHQVQK